MEISVKEIARLAGGVVDGDESAMVSGFATIEAAGKGCLTFLANPKYEHHVYDSKATAILISKDFKAEKPYAATLIRVADPYASLALLMEMAAAMQPQPVGVEPQTYVSEGVELPEGIYLGAFAYIGKGVKLGRNVKIYPQAYIGDGCTIGDDCIIRAGVKIYEGCRIGARCVIHSGAVIGADGFGFAPTAEGYRKIPQLGHVEIGDDVEIGANTTIDRATFGATKIGQGTKLDNLIQIAHNVELGSHNVFASQSGVAGSAKIGSWNRVGGQVGFAGPIKVGDNNEFGAQSGIPGNVGSGKRLIGYPAVDAKEFARNIIYVKRLRELFTPGAKK